ncbi:RtcB family protein [Caldisericum sp. AR60]|uniref:RtcB family protein n=1 Tax=Caldisericum sp. AR60 TaxID=3397852 RepID=UPI0039FB8B19
MEFKRLSPYKFLIEKHGDMRVDALLISSHELIQYIEKDKALEQLIWVATLPGIVKYSIGMPDIHQGYAFPIGGVGAFLYDGGVVSPGGVGFDINCGVRVIKTNLKYSDIKDSLEELGKTLFKMIPAGLGSTSDYTFSIEESKRAMKLGLDWAIEKGFGDKEDIENVEDNGRLEGDPDCVSKRAIERGCEEFGTLGAGNHFLEVDKVVEIYDKELANVWGLFEGQIVIWIHTGSRGLGHQIATDYLDMMRPKMEKFKFKLVDKDSVYFPIQEDLSQRYLLAMGSAANFAWVNRQVLTYFVRKAFSKVFGMDYKKLGMGILYDVAHNIAKQEQYEINGKLETLLVHRKGATRSFPKGHPKLKGKFKETGQPVLLPGDMKRGSYILVGSEKSIKETFGSVAHGAGRILSRHQAVKQITFEDVQMELQKEGILLYANDKVVAREEAPDAYKSIDLVVEPIVKEGLASLVARSKPLIVVKG